MRRARLGAAAIAVTLGLLTAGCAGGTTTPGAAKQLPDDGPQLVGVAMPTKVQERWIGDGKNLRKQLVSLGYDVDLEYADDDVATQVASAAEDTRQGSQNTLQSATDLAGMAAQLKDLVSRFTV